MGRRSPNNEFDFLSIAYIKLKKNSKYADFCGGKMRIKEVYRICGVVFSLKKHQTRKLLKCLCMQYDDFELTCHEIRFRPKMI